MRHFDETYPGNSCGVRVRRQIRQCNLHRYQSPITLLRYYVATPCPFHIATTLRKGPSIKYVYKIFRMFTSLLILSAFHSTYQHCSSTIFAYFSIQAVFRLLTRYSQHMHGSQGLDGGPQVPLLGHGDEVESPNWAHRDCRKWNGKIDAPRRTPASLGGMSRPVLPLSWRLLKCYEGPIIKYVHRNFEIFDRLPHPGLHFTQPIKLFVKLFNKLLVHKFSFRG